MRGCVQDHVAQVERGPDGRRGPGGADEIETKELDRAAGGRKAGQWPTRPSGAGKRLVTAGISPLGKQKRCQVVIDPQAMESPPFLQRGARWSGDRDRAGELVRAVRATVAASPAARA